MDVGEELAAGALGAGAGELVGGAVGLVDEMVVFPGDDLEAVGAEAGGALAGAFAVGGCHARSSHSKRSQPKAAKPRTMSTAVIMTGCPGRG